MELTKINTLIQRVEHCLERYPETRNSDIDLQARLLENYYPPIEHPIYNWRDVAYTMHKVPTLDHIARARRKVIENHKYTRYLPTDPEVAKRRKISEQAYQEYMSKKEYPKAIAWNA